MYYSVRLLPRERNLTVTRCVVILGRCGLEVNLFILGVVHDFSDLAVEFVLGALEPLLEFCGNEFVFSAPLFEALCDEFGGKSLELLIGYLHLVVLCVEYDTLLYLVDVLLVEYVLADAQLLDPEVGLQCVPDRIAALLSDATVENLQLDHALVDTDQLRNSHRSFVPDARITEAQLLDGLI